MTYPNLTPPVVVTIGGADYHVRLFLCDESPRPKTAVKVRPFAWLDVVPLPPREAPEG